MSIPRLVVTDKASHISFWHDQSPTTWFKALTEESKCSRRLPSVGSVVCPLATSTQPVHRRRKITACRMPPSLPISEQEIYWYQQPLVKLSSQTITDRPNHGKKQMVRGSNMQWQASPKWRCLFKLHFFTGSQDIWQRAILLSAIKVWKHASYPQILNGLSDLTQLVLCSYQQPREKIWPGANKINHLLLLTREK